MLSTYGDIERNLVQLEIPMSSFNVCLHPIDGKSKPLTQHRFTKDVFHG